MTALLRQARLMRMKNESKTMAGVQDQQREQHAHHCAREMEAFYKSLACAMTRHPQFLVVTVESVGGSLALTAEPHPEDAGKLIGSRAAMFHSFRSVLAQFARKRGYDVHYNIEDDKTHTRERGAEPFKAREDWPRQWVESLFEATLASLFERDTTTVWEHNAVKSVANVRLDAAEPVRVADAELKDGLSRVFMAVGKAHGREIYVDSVERRRTSD